MEYHSRFPNGRTKEGFYKLREEFNTSWKKFGTCPENEHLLHLLIQLSFNSLLRFSKTGFNTPYGRKEVDLERIKMHSEIAIEKGLEFIHGDYKKIPLDWDPKNTLIYFDPPYAASKFKYGGWNKNDEISLLQFIDKCGEMGYHWVLSNTFSHRGEENPELFEWSKKYNVTHIGMSYNSWSAAVSSVKKELFTDEVIVSNYPLES